MKKKRHSIIIGIMVLAFVSGVNPVTDCLAKDKTIRLRLNNPLPPTHQLAVKIFDPWAKFVEEKSNGRVKIQNFHGGSLSKLRDVWEGTLGGMWDISILIPAFKYDNFIGSLIAELPFLFPDHVTATNIMGSFIEKWTLEEFKDVKIAAINCSGLLALWSKKKVTKIEDFKGMKVGVPGRGWKKVLEAWGATPVSISVGEIYMALDRGTVDAMIFTITGGSGMRFQEVSAYVSKLKAQSVLSVVVMNKNTWNRLPNDIQTLFDDVLFPELGRLFVNTWTTGDKQVWDEIEKAGKAVDISPEMMVDLRRGVRRNWDDWIKKATAKGYPAKEMMSDMKQRLRKAGVKIQ
jgi:TRAP-type C4-dicarboxylate transport system substrate-binding protein